jgi:hypothetical protein
VDQVVEEMEHQETQHHLFQDQQEQLIQAEVEVEQEDQLQDHIQDLLVDLELLLQKN